MKLKLPLTILLLTLATVNLNGQTYPEKTGMELINGTLVDYIEGSTNVQPNRLKSAFHDVLNL